MAPVRAPQRGRETVSANKAAKLLRKDRRTVQKMIEDGEIAGGIYPGGKQNRWWVYLDQLVDTAPRPEQVDLLAENTQLRAQVAETEDLRRRLGAAEAKISFQNEELASMRSSNIELTAAMGAIVAATEKMREGHRQTQAAVNAAMAGAGNYEQANAELFKVIGGLQTTLGQQFAPSNLGEMGFPEADA